MKKVVVKLVSLLLISLLPIGGFFIYGKLQKTIYGDSFYAELNEKYERLVSTKESDNRIIFIGGSSLSFGLRSDEIEKATGYKVVDFGLYAQLGTRIMSDLALDQIKENDVVIFAPEISKETYSTNINYSIALKCFENTNLASKLSLKDNEKLFYNYFPYVIEKANAEINLQEPYTKSSFNEYCDISSSFVKQNILLNHFDEGNIIAPSIDLLDNDFISYVNEYNKKIVKKGAKMYFSFSPSNRLALDESGLENFEQSLSNRVDCEILGSVKEFTYNENYFYDTNYHLNYAGSMKHSYILSTLIKNKLHISNSYSIPQMDEPEPLYRLGNEIYSSDYLELKEVTSMGVTNYVVTGIKAEYKTTLENIFIPNFVNDKKIVSVQSNAVTDMPLLKTIVFSKNIETLEANTFVNCPNLTKIYLTHDGYPPTVNNGFLNNLSSDILIYILSMKNYASGYNWDIYSSCLRLFKLQEIEELMH